MNFLKTKTKKLKSINDLVDIKITSNLEIDRKMVKILVIDDEGFLQKESLNKLGYKDIDVKFESGNMEDYKAYDIIFCDINGVANDIDPYFQGAALAKKIKEIYPDKFVVIFSALDQSLDFYPYYSSVDDTIIKNLTGNKLSDKIDEYIETINNPKYKWESIKKLLESNGISTYDISVFEDYYVSSILDKKDYTSKVEKYCKDSMITNHKIIEKILPYVIDIMKDVVICYVTK